MLVATIDETDRITDDDKNGEKIESVLFNEPERSRVAVSGYVDDSRFRRQ